MITKRMPGDEVVRGLLYLIGWSLVAPLAFAGLGGALFGILGLVVGLAISTAIGIVGFAQYLRWRAAQ